jgi:hypothetical protein
MDKTRASVFAGVLAMAVIASACSTPGTGSAPGGAAEEANYMAKTEKEDEQLICRREQPTGSRISERICLTAEDWDKMEQQSQEMLDRATRKAQQYPDQ